MLAAVVGSIAGAALLAALAYYAYHNWEPADDSDDEDTKGASKEPPQGAVINGLQAAGKL